MKQKKLFEVFFKTKVPLSLVIITFSLIAVNLITQPQPVNGFQPLEIKLTNYETHAVKGMQNFTVLINDSRQGETYLSKILVDDVLVEQLELKNGTNNLSIQINKKGRHKVKIEIWNPANEYNGYGYESNPFTLFYMVDVQ